MSGSKRSASSSKRSKSLDAVVKASKDSSERAKVISAQAMGLQQKTTAQAHDFFANLIARTGYGSPNLIEGTEYPLVRLTYNYWLLISLYEAHWVVRRIVDVPAQDMVRAWPTLTSDIEPKDLARIDRALRRTNTKNQMLTAMIWGRLFGGAGALIVVEGQENELDEPLDLDSIPVGGFKGLCPFDRWSGIYPSSDWSTDINKPLDFNLPTYYTVQATGGQSFKVHASRILRFTGLPVPTPEREAYSMFGISVIEPLFQDLQKRDNVSFNIALLTFRANILGMKFPDLAALLSGLGMPGQAGEQFEQRMAAVNHLISNQSLVPLPEGGSIESTSYSFAGLGEVYQQFCLDISGAAQIPVTRLWGRTITGLGQGNEGDEKVYVERIATDQDAYLRPQLEKLFPVICQSELGEVPDDLDMNFPSLAVPDDKDKAELAKSVADVVVVALNSGLISPRTAAMELKQASTKTGVFTNITDEEVDALSDKPQSEGEVGEGLFGKEGEGAGGGLTPASSPSRVIREENREGKEQEAGGTGAVPGKKVGPAPAENLVGSQAKDADGSGPTRHFHGLDVVIETPRGYLRHGRDEHGKSWEQTLTADYGYIKGHQGADGDSLDCYVGDDLDSDWVYLVDQAVLGNRKKFDETKVMTGFQSQGDALRTYRANHHRSKDVFLDFVPMRVDDFKEWLATRDPKKPASDLVKS
jgi:phage-related protein (TIGR01555 family)